MVTHNLLRQYIMIVLHDVYIIGQMALSNNFKV